MARAGRTRYNPETEPAWSHVATLPGDVKVTVREELARGRRLYLWWRNVDGRGKPNWAKKALGEVANFGYGLRDADGVIRDDVARWAAMRAAEQCAILAGDPVALARAGAETVAPPVLLTLGATKALLTDPEKGPYPHDTPHRRELLRELEYATTVFGAERTWATIDRDEMTKLARRRMSAVVEGGHTGFRSSEILIQRIASIARWLIEKRLIPEGCGVPYSKWRTDLRDYWRGLTKSERDPQPSRPRHTVEELRKLLVAAWDVDPRFALMFELGAEYRLGQVRRARRSDLALDRGDHGELTIHGAGKKRGEVIELTAGQRAAVERAFAGVYAPLEAAYTLAKADYRLFPAGHLRNRGTERVMFGPDIDATKSVSREWVIKSFHLVEEAAQVPTVKGRGPYGARRVSTDENLAAGISQSGLQAAGGWSDPSTPMAIYRDNENRRGRSEARDIRAKVRGEALGEADPKADTPRTQNVHNDEGPATQASTPDLQGGR